MRTDFQEFDFPSQRVSDVEKDKPEWYANCCDWIIAQGQSYRDQFDIEKKYNVLQGNIDTADYHKILNPYNVKNKKYLRYPADMRNYDLIKGNIRRYVGEYLQNPHDFIVSANNAEVVLAKNSALRAELMKLAQQRLAEIIQQKFSEYMEQGGDPKQFKPQEHVDTQQFIKDFNEQYIDDISAQGANILKVIQDVTEDTLIYAEAYFNYVAFGEYFTYTDVVGDKLIKRVVKPRDAFPVPNDSMFVEDYDMFAERRKMTYQQIIDEFDEYLTDKDRAFLDTYYAKHSTSGMPAELVFADYERYYPDVCNKYSYSDREVFKKSRFVMPRDANSDMYDVWHVVWRGEVKKAIVQYITEAGMIGQRVEVGDYKLNPDAGDIDVEYIYEPQVYESVRIGGRNDAVYPYKARALAYTRKGKLPYNGLVDVLPGFGKFSIIDIITPYQMFYNIVAFQREMAVAKNKVAVLMIAKSLLGKAPDEVIHKMLADGVLYIDDEEDQGMLRAQQVRYLNASYGDWIRQLSDLLDNIENAAKLQVDMTAQRYGEIANSAGKGVTEEAIMRGSMGSVLIEFMMDCGRERDYARDMDYSKFAWIEGLNTSYRDNGDIKYISLDVNSHIYADYVIKAKNSIKLKQKFESIKQIAFNASQNGDIGMAIAAIKGENIEQIQKLIEQYEEKKALHDEEMKEMDAQIKQMEQEFEIQKIHAKGEEDRATATLEGMIDKEIELIRADANMNSYNNDISVDTKEEAVNRLNAERSELDKQKLNLEKTKFMADFYSKNEDRRLKEKDIDTKLKIARTNKNRYDKK